MFWRRVPSGLWRWFRKPLVERPRRFESYRLRLRSPKRATADAVRQVGCEGELTMNYFVYILQCADGDLYTGCTDNLDERLKRHNHGYVPATKDRLPAKLISYTAFIDKYKAFNFEKYLKSGSGRAFLKKRLI